MSKWQKEKRLGLVDLDTGEMFGANIRPWKSKIGGRWVKKFQNGAQLLLSEAELHGQSYKVLAHLETVLEWGNKIPAPPSIAKVMKLNVKAVYRCYAELIKADIVVKKDMIYYLSPIYCWKGNDRDLKEAMLSLVGEGNRWKLVKTDGSEPESDKAIVVDTLQKYQQPKHLKSLLPPAN